MVPPNELLAELNKAPPKPIKAPADTFLSSSFVMMSTDNNPNNLNLNLHMGNHNTKYAKPPKRHIRRGDQSVKESKKNISKE